VNVNSNNTFNQIIQKAQVSSKSQEVNETKESSNIPKEEYETENSLSKERYDALAINGWFKDSIFEKDENLKEEFKNYLGEMTQREFSTTLFSMISSFSPGMVSNDDLKPLHLASIHKDPNVVFSSISNITNYFQDNYNTIVENVNKWGTDASEALQTVSKLLNFFQSYESKQQENEYVSLGQRS